MRPWLTLLPWFISCLVSQAAASNSSEARFRPIPISNHMRLCSVPPLFSPRLAVAGILEREGRVDAAHRDSRSDESHEVSGREDSSIDWFQRAGYGVFVHYLEDLQNDPQQVHRLGRETTWDECVCYFDHRRFADALA